MPTLSSTIRNYPKVIAPGGLCPQGYASAMARLAERWDADFPQGIHDFRGRLSIADAAPSIGAFQTP
jgi:hypothetical protein